LVPTGETTALNCALPTGQPNGAALEVEVQTNPSPTGPEIAEAGAALEMTVATPKEAATENRAIDGLNGFVNFMSIGSPRTIHTAKPPLIENSFIKAMLSYIFLFSRVSEFYSYSTPFQHIL
jgi:hypothetical protein